MPRVSVIIPCYNHGEFISDAVKSIINQTYQDFEIIIINDGSDDDYTNKILSSNMNFEKTKIINTSKVGVSKARNIGIQDSKGDYILTLDADDWFENTFIEKAVPILDTDDEIGVVTCGIRYFGKENFTVYPKGGGIKNFLLINNACGNSLFRKECWLDVGGYDESFVYGSEDWEFWISVTQKGWEVYVIPEILFNYRKHGVSRDKKANEMEIELFSAIFQKHRETYYNYLDELIINLKKSNNLLKHNLYKTINSKSFFSVLTPIRFFRWMKNKIKLIEYVIDTQYK